MAISRRPTTPASTETSIATSDSKKYGSAKGSRVALARTTRGPEDWKAFDGTLGARRKARPREGPRRPGVDHGAAAPPVVLSTRAEDVTVLPDSP